ncbi:MAG: phosphatase PAP2 family protein [Candidatus Krumholzibacteria bacterium]|nr:phosphatase PAP2 family protein [Candidatus Krumholzibacteria bacterium]
MQASHKWWIRVPRRLAPLILVCALHVAPPLACAGDFSDNQNRVLGNSIVNRTHTPPGTIHAQRSNDRPDPKRRLYFSDYAFGFMRDLGYDYTRQLGFPVRYVRNHPKRFLAGILGMGSLILTDHLTYDWLAPRAKLRENDLLQPAQDLSNLVHVGSTVRLVVALGSYGVLARAPKEQETALMLFEAVVTSATWTQLLKGLTGRERPRETEGNVSVWSGPGTLWNPEIPAGKGLRSFPSGHATGMWAVSTILAHQYPKYLIVPSLAYGTAVAASYSRMAVGAHWLSDVVVGGLIGYGSAKQVLSAHDNNHGRRTHPLHIGLDLAGNYKGVNIRYDF